MTKKSLKMIIRIVLIIAFIKHYISISSICKKSYPGGHPYLIRGTHLGSCQSWDCQSINNNILLLHHVAIFSRKKQKLAAKLVLTFCQLKKREKKILYPPQPPCDVVPLFKLPVENNKHPNLRWRRKRVGVDCPVL